MDDALDRMMGVGVEFVASATWQGSKAGYYFGTTDEKTGYYLDNNKTSTSTTSSSTTDDPTANNNKRKRKGITIDETQNKVKSIPPRRSAAELLEQAEQEHEHDRVLDVTERGIKSALTQLEKVKRNNALRRAKYPDDPEQYMESELVLHQQVSIFSGVATKPQLFAAVDLTIFLDLLTHPNHDIASCVIHVLCEWLDLDGGGEDDLKDDVEPIRILAKTIVDSTILELMISNLGRLDISTKEDDETDQQGVEDILTLVEQLVELLPPQDDNNNTTTGMDVAAYIAKETTLCSWLVAQLPQEHGRSAEILALLVQQPSLHNHGLDWTKLPLYNSILVEDDEEDDKSKQPSSSTTLDALEIMLQGIAQFRKRQPETAAETDFLENLVLTLASALLFSEGDTFRHQFASAQGPELIVRCLKEKVHAGGVGLALLDIRAKPACEQLVTTTGALKYLFPIFMGRSIPKPAASKGMNPKSKRAWVLKLEEHVILILYNLTRFLSDKSPADAKQRLLVKFLDHDKLDRLVELLLGYDTKAQKAEFKFYRNNDNDDDDDDDEMAALAAKLAGGGDLFHRLGAICAFVCVNSKKSHAHILEQLTLQQSGIGLIKTALQEFITVLADQDQKTQLQEYLEQI